MNSRVMSNVLLHVSCVQVHQCQTTNCTADDRPDKPCR